MQTKTLDSVIREALLDSNLPIHYYMVFSHHAKKCIETLSLDFSLGQNIKELKVSVNDHNRFSIPNDSIGIIGVYGIYGGERREFSINTTLTTAYKLNDSNKVPWLENDSSFPDNQQGESSIPIDQTMAVDYPTIYYPTNQVDYEYNIDNGNNEVILGSRVNMEEVYVWYISNMVSKTSANVVNYHVAPVIISYIDYMIAKSNGTAQSRVIEKKDIYYNEKRLLRGRLNPLKVSDFYEIFSMN